MYTNYIDHHLAGRAGFWLLPLHVFGMVDDVTSRLLSDITMMTVTLAPPTQTDTSGLLDDVTDTSPSHPGSMTDSTVRTVDLAAGQDMWQAP